MTQAFVAGQYAAMAKEPAFPNLENLPQIEVWLVEPIERMKGWSWSISKTTGAPLSITAIQEPAHLAVHLPSGRVLESYAEGALIKSEDGYVSEVVLWPLPELAKTYDDVVDAAEAIVRRWKIDNRELNKGLAEWRGMYEKDPFLLPEEDRAPNLKLYANAEIELDIWLSPERGIHRSNRGWYLAMHLSGSDAIDRKIGREVFKYPRSNPKEQRPRQ